MGKEFPHYFWANDLTTEPLSSEIATILSLSAGVFTPPYTLFQSAEPDYVNHSQIVSNTLMGGADDQVTIAVAIGKLSSLSANQMVFDIGGTSVLLRVRNDGANYRFQFVLKDTTGTNVANVHNTGIALAIDTNYGVLGTFDYTGASQIRIVNVNNNTTQADVNPPAADTGGFRFDSAAGGSIFGNNTALSQPLDACLGPIWIKKALADTTWSDFFNADNTPKDWSLLGKGIPEVFIKNWRETGAGGVIINHGSGDDLNHVTTTDPVVGTLTQCSI